MSLTIKTNTSSLIAQNSLKTSTNKLNQAIERMSSGAKINHAKDNAANYSIATNMTTKINALQVAEDNCAMGLDLISTASSSLEQMSDLTSRLRSLATQAQNGTYGDKSIEAINTEAQSIIDELYRVKNTTQYNGINLFDGATKTTFSRRDTSAMTPFSSVDELTKVTGGTYSISTAEDLIKLSKMCQYDKIDKSTEFVLANNIDLSAYSSGEGWEPIVGFKAQFDGNGYVISNLYINRQESASGLFGQIVNATISNLGLKNVNVTGGEYCSAGLAGGAIYGCTISNCYVTGTVTGEKQVGGLLGDCENGSVIDCYSTVEVQATVEYVGGLVGLCSGSTVTNCYTINNVDGKTNVGGLLGSGASSVITDCYAIGNIKGVTDVGGLIGAGGTVKNCYATGNVSGNRYVGGLMGEAYQAKISDSYATGNASGEEDVGGLVGRVGGDKGSLTNCYATGNVTGTGSVGGLVGTGRGAVLTDCYSTGNATGTNFVGGLVGTGWSGTFTNCYATGSATGTSNVGGLVAGGNSGNFTNCYATGKVSGNSNTGGLIGNAYQAVLENTYFTDSTGQVSGIGGSNVPASGETVLVTASELQELIREQILPYFKVKNTSISFQIGINSSDSSQIQIESLRMNLLSFNNLDMSETTSITTIDEVLKSINDQQTTLGAAQNRLESALDEISTQYENLVSSRSTIMDADMAEVSSEYIRQQILQEASATLMATANQSPAIALQLL